MIACEYSYIKTMHLTFDERVGIGSYGFTDQEFEKITPKPEKTLQEYETITERIDIIIESVLGFDIKINWINTCKVNIDNILIDNNNYELELIEKLENYINLAFREKGDKSEHRNTI